MFDDENTGNCHHNHWKPEEYEIVQTLGFIPTIAYRKTKTAFNISMFTSFQAMTEFATTFELTEFENS
jgi:hypothetical protein